MRVDFTVDGPPVGWQRSGENRYTGRHYTQDKTRNQKEAVALAYRIKARACRFPSGTPLILIVWAYMPIPKSATLKRKKAMMANAIMPTVKSDWDNLGKLVSDALNGVAYDDDKDIVLGIVAKQYSQFPRTEVTISDELDSFRLFMGRWA